MIDYGYSGTFNNILITTSSSGLKLKTAKKDEFSEGHTGFTGTITIEEYSPYVMKGSYSGELYSYVGTNAPYRGPLPSKREKQIKISATGSVNGEFNTYMILAALAGSLLLVAFLAFFLNIVMSLGVNGVIGIFMPSKLKTKDLVPAEQTG